MVRVWVILLISVEVDPLMRFMVSSMFVFKPDFERLAVAFSQAGQKCGI